MGSLKQGIGAVASEMTPDGWGGSAAGGSQGGGLVCGNLFVEFLVFVVPRW